jgi:hypothetical protein
MVHGLHGATLSILPHQAIHLIAGGGRTLPRFDIVCLTVGLVDAISTFRLVSLAATGLQLASADNLEIVVG